MSKAFGKIILAGEHAVVYGYPAIASTLNLQVCVSVQHSAHPGLKFVNPKIDPEHQSTALFAQILPKLTQLFGNCVAELEFQIDSDLPGGCGLGSSAALSVALIRAILDFIGESRSVKEIASMALELEKIFHGNPSGVDHTVIAQEGLIWFQQGFSERIQAGRPFKLVAAIASPHAGTLAAVQAVRKNYEANQIQVTKLFEEISKLTHAMRTHIEQGNLLELGQLMTRNHELLQNLGVSTDELDTLCLLAKREGALGAKLTGAGGGGCVIALVSDTGSSLLHAYEQAGYRSFVC